MTKTNRTALIVNFVIVALALTVSACGKISRTKVSDLGPTQIELAPAEWSQPNVMVDPAGKPADVTVALREFAPPINSTIISTVGIGQMPKPGEDQCAGNRCSSGTVYVCNNTSSSKFVKLFWSSDGIRPIMTSAGGPQPVAGGTNKNVPAGGCDTSSWSGKFFPPGARQLLAVLPPREMPGWNESWPSIAFDFKYNE